MKLKYTLKQLLPLLPPYLQRILRTKAALRRAKQNAARKQRTQIDVADVLARLTNLKLSGDLMVHGSISNIGKLDKPVSVLVNAWIAQLDLKNQTLLVPALPYNTTMREYLEDSPTFDVRSAKNAMGAISNIVMAIPEARRSIHPTHSVVALGANSDLYVNGHELDCTPFGPNSPYRKLTEREGKILMFGVGLNSVTCFHVYEDMLGDCMPLPVYLPEQFHIPCIESGGNALQVRTTCHNPRISAIRECERARSALIDAGAIVSYPLGESELSVVDAKLFTVTLLKMLADGKSIYGPVAVNAPQKKRISEWLERLS